MLVTLVAMLRDGSLLVHAAASTQVIVIGWAAAAVVAVPLGIVMGSFRLFEAVLEPPVNFVRYLPVSALIPLLILYVGIGDAARIAVVFIGTFFQLIIMVADVAAHVPRDLLDSAYTLGTRRWRVVTHVLFPATLPGVMDSLRLTIGFAWGYVVLAEIVAAETRAGLHDPGFHARAVRRAHVRRAAHHRAARVRHRSAVQVAARPPAAVVSQGRLMPKLELRDIAMSYYDAARRAGQLRSSGCLWRWRSAAS